MDISTLRKHLLNPFERPRRRFGELMLEARYLSEDELDGLLDEQRRNPTQRLGYLCIQHGYASRAEVMDVLTRQLPVLKPYSI